MLEAVFTRMYIGNLLFFFLNNYKYRFIRGRSKNEQTFQIVTLVKKGEKRKKKTEF